MLPASVPSLELIQFQNTRNVLILWRNEMMILASRLAGISDPVRYTYV